MPLDSITMVVTPFEGDEAFNEYLRKQLGQKLAYELNQFIIPVLPVEERDRRVYLFSSYQADADIDDRTDKEDIANPVPDYWCQGIISDTYVSAKISSLTTEETIANVQVPKKKKLDRQIKRLAEELAKALIKERYDYELDQLSLMGVRLPKGPPFKWVSPVAEQRGRTYWFTTSKDTRVLYAQVENQEGDLKELGPYPGIPAQSLQLWRIKKGPLNRSSLTPMRNRLSVGSHYFGYEQNSSFMLSTQYLFALSGKVAVGAGANYYRLPAEVQVETPPTIPAAPFISEEELLSFNLIGQYQHFSSKAHLFYGLQVGVQPLDLGGNATAFIGLPNLPWLRLELTAHTFEAELPAPLFQDNQLLAEQRTIQKRLLLLSAGVQITGIF